MTVLYISQVDDRRYERLARYHGLSATLPRWRETSAAVIGLGGLGGGLVGHLARLGVAKLVLIDRDAVSPENLGHQPLFTADDARQGIPKALAAQRVARQINPATAVTAQAVELTRRNIAELLDGVSLLFDGLDNYYARLLLNDYAHRAHIPYFYAGVVRGQLSARAVVPGVTGCLRCLVDRPPPAGSAPTCAAEGVFPPLLAVANALQLDAANRYLAGMYTPQDDVLFSLDTDSWRLVKTSLGGWRSDCPVCGQSRFEYLDGTLDALARGACAEGRVEASLASGGIDLEAAWRLLDAAGGFTLRRNNYCLVAETSGMRYTLFASGRVVLEGSSDPADLNRFIVTCLGS